jgi:N-acetylglucosaminyldiphosphoundecaprenol N-acetyl-beta-D-mannosaminyltransferase
MNEPSLNSSSRLARELVVVAGVPLDNLDAAEAADRIENFASEGGPHYVATANVNFIVTANRDPEFMEVVRMADLITPDGMPVVWASQKLGAPLKERVTGVDLVYSLAGRAEKKGLRLFFLGGGPGVGREAVSRLKARHPGLHAASFSPDFDPLLEMKNYEILARIRDFEPHVLFVSLGAGKAEKWMRMNALRLEVPVSMGVGAAVDFVSGRRSRAPLWMQRRGLEWVHRGLQEPRRLGKRYLRDFFFFNYYTRRQLYAQKWRRLTANKDKGELGLELTAGRHQVLAVSGRLDMDVAPELSKRGASILESDRDLILDLSSVAFMDSSGLGALAGLEKKARRTAKKFMLAAPSKAVRLLLKQARMEGFFRVIDELPSTDAAPAESENLSGAKRVIEGECVLDVNLSGRIDADSSGDLRRSLFDLVEKSEQFGIVRLNMADVTFIDSSGLAVLIALHKLLQSRSKSVKVAELSGDPARVFKIMKMDKYLDMS